MDIKRAGPEITINTLNPSYNPRHQQIENIDRQLRALMWRRGQLKLELAHEERFRDQRLTPQAAALEEDTQEPSSQNATRGEGWKL